MAAHPQLYPGNGEPSWLSFPGYTKDSRWSVDLFRCESILLKNHWVRYHQWQANLRILEIEEVKSVPYFPTSHPFIERLIGTIRREYPDRLFFWNAQDLEQKLAAFQHYYNEHRAHLSLKGSTPLLAFDNAQTQHVSSTTIYGNPTARAYI